MFKKVTTILLILTCLLIQYAKQFAYLECKIENISSQEPVCDCEKKYNTEPNSDGQQLPEQRSHVHLSIDEFELPADNYHHATDINFSTKFLNRNISFLSAYNGNIFHPPQS